MQTDPGSVWPLAPRDEPIAAGLAILVERPARLLLIEGEAGMGKSALASALAERLGGPRPLIVTGVAERMATPLGAFEDVLSSLGMGEGSALGDLVAALGRTAERRVVIVDDAPRLDAASAEVVRRLVGGFGMRVVASARRGAALPPPLQQLNEEGLVCSQHLGGLSVAEVRRVLEARFRVPAREEDVHRLFWETEGNPLHLRVIVESAIEAGEVLHRGDAVQIDRPPDPDGLMNIIAARLAVLSERARQLLRVVALTQPVARASILHHPRRKEDLAELLQGGMVVVQSETDRLMIAHPLVAEALDASRHEKDSVDEAVRLLRGSGDPTRRFAAVELEHRNGRRSAADELVWAAAYASARGDHRVAAELADASVREPARRTTAFAAHLGAATYHSLAGDLDAADRLFALADPLATHPGERATLASRLGEHLVFRRNDPCRALAQGEQARSSLTAQASVALDADLWRWRVFAERGGGDGGEATVRASIATAIAASMRGESAAALAAADPLRAAGVTVGPLATDAAIALGLQRVVELRSVGAADDAADFLESARADAGDEVGFFTVMLASQRAQEGRLAEGLRFAELAVEQLRRRDSGELLSLALALRATVNAQRGSLVLAREQLAELDNSVVSGAAVLQRAECESFLLASEGDRGGAVNTILEVVGNAAVSGYGFLGTLTLANALRFGEVDRTATLAEQLRDGLAEHVEPCIALCELAVALRDAKPERVAASAQRLARAGLVPAAIDGLGLATALPSSDATRRRLHSVALALSAGVDAPPLQRREGPALTARELAVARSAASRHRSREIAHKLGISARTVENQLHAVYKKLGVTSRDDLRIALRDIGLLTNEQPEDQPWVSDAPYVT